MAACTQCGGRANQRHSCPWCGKVPLCLKCACDCQERVPIHVRGEKPPELKEAQQLVGGYVELLTLPNGDQLLVNEEGAICEPPLPVNLEASRRWPRWGPLRGPVVHLQGDARWT